MKFPGEAAERLARLLLDGPATPAELAERLHQAPAGIRRTLASLSEHGLVSAADRPPFGPAPTRGRGRPSQVYSLTAKGRAALSQGYDGLALEALRFVQRTQGESGVYAFARERADRLMSARAIPAGDVAFAAPMIAEALTEAGYAAAVEAPSDQGPVVQICQHACPVIDAAVEFPSLCDAETDALSAVLGRHVTRLATLANGDGVCTTVIPTTVDSSRRAPA